MTNSYRFQLDFEMPQQTFSSLNAVFEILKDNEHITIYSLEENKEEYLKLVADESIDSSKLPFYIETSTESEGTFVPNIEFWIENYMLGAFYCPDKIPYIEELI